MNATVLLDRYNVPSKAQAKALAADIRRSFEEGMADLEALLRARDAEIEELQRRLDRYEPSPRPKKFA